MSRQRWTCLLLGLLLLTGGCVVKDPYRAAIQGSSDVSQAVSSAIKITASYYSAGTFDDKQKAEAAHYFTIVTDCNMGFRKAVVAVHASGQTGASVYVSVADTLVKCVQNGAPSSSDQKVKDVLKGVDTVLNGISLAIQQAKGGQ